MALVLAHDVDSSNSAVSARYARSLAEGGEQQAAVRVCDEALSRNVSTFEDLWNLHETAIRAAREVNDLATVRQHADALLGLPSVPLSYADRIRNVENAWTRAIIESSDEVSAVLLEVRTEQFLLTDEGPAPLPRLTADTVDELAQQWTTDIPLEPRRSDFPDTGPFPGF